MEYYYRYKEVLFSEGRLLLNLIQYPVLKHTIKGVWIEEYFGKKKFVLKNSRKRFACPTKEEALESFRARKKRQIKLLKAQLIRAEAALNANPEDDLIYFIK